MNKKIKTDAVDELFEAILHLKTVEECYAFFEDVCTVNELLSFSQRYEVGAYVAGRSYIPGYRGEDGCFDCLRSVV